MQKIKMQPGRQSTSSSQTGSGRNQRGRCTGCIYLQGFQGPSYCNHQRTTSSGGQTAVLKVLQVTKIGAFLDWGLEKDLLLPYHEQTSRVREGQECLVALYVDKSSRLCATMKVYHYLSTRTPYVAGDSVKGRVYEISDRFGVFVAVDDKYSA